MSIYNRVGFVPTIEDKLLFEKSTEGRVGYSFTELGVPQKSPSDVWSNENLCRSEVKGFPEISENEVVRHFTRLSQKNFAIDLGMYPLGSCTMKYNPKINEELARIPELTAVHPFWPSEFLQSAFQIQYRLQQLLAITSGLEGVTLQPSAGAHGEYTGMKIIQAYHRKKGQIEKKTKVLIPESAHGTNPATCAMLGFEIVSIPTNDSGVVEISDVKNLIDDQTAGIMMTNPNTCGLFEENIFEISKMIHDQDALFYMDGANFNALLGITRPGDLGVDVMHINLHKTFSTPHGGGGPGAGAVCVRSDLSEFLPTPVIKQANGQFDWDYDLPNSIGRVGGYFGNFSIHVRALAYMLSIGTTPDGKNTYLRQIAEASVINANYIKARLKDHFKIPYDRHCMHEVLLSDDWQQENQVKTNDVAKRLMDFGFHPMTVYFPLVVSGAMLIEPTESETKENLDEFCEAMIAIAEEAKSDSSKLHQAPHHMLRKRVDELKAQKDPILRWSDS